MNKKQEKSMTLKVDKDKLIFEFNKKVGKHLMSAAKEANKEQQELIRKAELKIKLNKIFSENPDFVFYDYDNECVGNDLLKLISTLLKEECQSIIEMIEKMDYCDGGDGCQCKTEMEKYINIGREAVIKELIKSFK